MLLKIPASLPRVKVETQAPVPRVTFKEPICNQSNTDDLPDLIVKDNSITDLSNKSQDSTLQNTNATSGNEKIC